MKLFVYGTLKRGQVSQSLLSSATFIQEDSLENVTMETSRGWFPMMRLGGNQTITGEVYEVPDALWPLLDRYEGVPSLFDRREVKLASGTTAIVYEYQS